MRPDPRRLLQVLDCVPQARTQLSRVLGDLLELALHLVRIQVAREVLRVQLVEVGDALREISEPAPDGVDGLEELRHGDVRRVALQIRVVRADGGGVALHALRGRHRRGLLLVVRRLLLRLLHLRGRAIRPSQFRNLILLMLPASLLPLRRRLP